MEQRSDEWWSAKLGKVGSSTIAAVISKGRGNEPSKTRDRLMGKLIAETLTGRRVESYQSDEMEDGVEREPLACIRYELVTQQMVETCGFIQHPQIDRAGASPDRLVGDDGLTECKCPAIHTHIEYLMSGQPPSKYQPQMAWQLACTGRQWCDFVSFNPEMPPELQLFVVRYVPPAGYIATLERAVREFLREMDAKIADLKGLRAPQDIAPAITAPPASAPRVVTINPNIF